MLRFKIFVFFLAYLNIARGDNNIVKDLGGAWSVKDAENDSILQATVPGGIYSDLMNNGIIGDVFYGYNDVDTRWVAKKNWTYFRNVDINESVYDRNAINLVFDGIDTFAEIYVNDELVGTTDNMFVQYVLDIKSAIWLGDNTIKVKFSSPVERATELFNIQAQNYAVPPACVPSAYQGECHVNHIRKMQASFAWDWGPAFPSVGIWKPVYLEAYDNSVIRDATVDIAESDADNAWLITTKIYFNPPASSVSVEGNVLITLTTDMETETVAFIVNVSEDENGDFVLSRTFSISKLHVQLWWPNGFGNSVLYNMAIKFTSNNEDVSLKEFKVGFRTVQLVQNNLTDGNSFYFVVNNVPIFAKGSNSIPVSVLPEKGQDVSTIRYLLQSAKDVHMNMIRVWGGGVYESDAFYDIADEMGIMVWQDFMFACSMYPVNSDFLRTVKNEVKHQVRRLQHHPSVVLWAGNNENEAALRQNWYGTSGDFDTYHADYIKLYVNTIREEVLKSDISRQFLTSSPTNGVASDADNYVAVNPQSDFYGDVHYYDYISNPWNQNHYPLPRFASEYGLQSLPSMSTLQTATDNITDLKFNSAFMRHRQHHPAGNEEMLLLISEQLHLPLSSGNFFKGFIYYGQIIQAMGMKVQTEFYRIWKSNFADDGKGLTMGALYWQLNDVWVAPTWSGIDFKLNWKMLHYYAKNFFSPVIITYHLQTSGDIDFYVVSDLMVNHYNSTAMISVYQWNSTDVLYEDRISVDVMSGFSKSFYTAWLEQYLSNSGCGDTSSAKKTCFIRLSLTDNNGNQLAPDNFVFPTKLRSANLEKSIVKVASVTKTDESGLKYEITVESSSIALFVWLEADNIRGVFSDNGFLQYTTSKTIQFTAEVATTENQLKEALSVTHLLDSAYVGSA